jgi:hypothetical protein
VQQPNFVDVCQSLIDVGDSLPHGGSNGKLSKRKGEMDCEQQTEEKKFCRFRAKKKGELRQCCGVRLSSNVIYTTRVIGLGKPI